jgi:hypothetical protein
MNTHGLGARSANVICAPAATLVTSCAVATGFFLHQLACYGLVAKVCRTVHDAFLDSYALLPAFGFSSALKGEGHNVMCKKGQERDRQLPYSRPGQGAKGTVQYKVKRDWRWRTIVMQSRYALSTTASIMDRVRADGSTNLGRLWVCALTKVQSRRHCSTTSLESCGKVCA